MDVLSLTETWLKSDNGDDVLLAVCPPGYAALHNPRTEGRGGGVAVPHRTSVRVSRVGLENFEPKSFEFIAVTVHVNSVLFLLVTIYRPLSHGYLKFWPELTTLLERRPLRTRDCFWSVILTSTFTRQRIATIGNWHASLTRLGSSNMCRTLHVNRIATIGNWHASLTRLGSSNMCRTLHVNRTLDLVISPCDTDFVRECHVTSPSVKLII